MSIKHVISLEVKDITKYLLASGYNVCDLPFERSFIIKKNICVLFLVCLVYNSLVNVFYFHEYSYTFEHIKHNWM